MAPTTKTSINIRTFCEPEVLVKKKMQILGGKLFGALSHSGSKNTVEDEFTRLKSEENANGVNSRDEDDKEPPESLHYTSENSLSASLSSDKNDVDHSVPLLNTRNSEKLSPDIINKNDEGGVETILQPIQSFGSISDIGNDISVNSREKCIASRFRSPSIDCRNFKIDFSKRKRQKDRHVNLMINRSYFALPSVTSKIIDERNRELFDRLTPVFNNSIIDHICDGKELLKTPIEVTKNRLCENLNFNKESRTSREDSVKSKKSTEKVENISDDRVETCIDPLTSKLYEVDYGNSTIKQISYKDVEFIDKNTQDTSNIKTTQPLDKISSNQGKIMSDSIMGPSLDKISCNQEKIMSDSKMRLSTSHSANNTFSSDMHKSKKNLHSIKSSISRHRIFVRRKSVRGNMQRCMSMFQSYMDKLSGAQNTQPEHLNSANDIQQNQMEPQTIGAESDEIYSVSSIKSMNILNSQNPSMDVEQTKVRCPTHISGTKENTRNKKPKKANSAVRLHKVSYSDIIHGNNKPEKRTSSKRRKESRIQNLRPRKTSCMYPNKGVSTDLNYSKKTSANKRNQGDTDIRILPASKCTTRKRPRKSSKTNTRGSKPVHSENINTFTSPHMSGNILAYRHSQHRLPPTSAAVTGVDRMFPQKATGRWRTANVRAKSQFANTRTSSLAKANQQRECFREVSKSRDRGSRTLLLIQKRPVQQSVSLYTKSQPQKLPVGDHSYTRRRPATATNKKSPFKKRNSSTNLKYTEKQNDNTTVRMCVTPNPNPRVPNNTDMESQVRAYSCLGKKNKSKSRTRSFVTLHIGPPLNHTVRKCGTQRKSRRSKFLESRLNNRLSDVEEAKDTLRSTPLNTVSVPKRDNLTENAMSPLFNTQQNVVLDDPIFFTYHEPVTRSKRNRERKLGSASRLSSPRTQNSLYFSIDRQKGINYISDICINRLLSPLKTVKVNEINSTQDENSYLPQRDGLPITKSNTECKIPTFYKEDKLKKNKARELRECTEVRQLNEEMETDINGTSSSRFVTQNSECNSPKNCIHEGVNTIQRIIDDSDNDIKFQPFKDEKNVSLPAELDKSCGNENRNAHLPEISVNETSYKCSSNSFPYELHDLTKNMENSGFQYVLKEETEDNGDGKQVLSTSEERNLQHLRSNEKCNTTSLIAMKDSSKNNVGKEGNHETSPAFRSILKKGTNDWINITSFPEEDSPPQQYDTKHEGKTLNDGVNLQKNSSTVQSSLSLKSCVNIPNKVCPLQNDVFRIPHPSIITDYNLLQEFMKSDTMITAKPYNFFIHSSPVSVLSESNVSSSSDSKLPLIQKINTTESVKRILLSRSSHRHKAHFQTDGEEIRSSKIAIGNSDDNGASNGNKLVSSTTALSIDKLKPVTSRKTVTFKIPIHEKANVKKTPSIHLPLQQEDLSENLPNNDVNHDLQLKELKKYTSLEYQVTNTVHSPVITSEFYSPRFLDNNLSEPNELTTFKQSTIKNVIKNNQYSPYIRQIRKRKTKIIHRFGRSFSSKPPLWVTSEPACSTSWIDIRAESPQSKGKHFTGITREKHYSPHRNSSNDISNSSSSQPSKRTSNEKRKVSTVLGTSLKRPLSSAVRRSATRRRTEAFDSQNVAKSPTRVSNTINYSQNVSGRNTNHLSHGGNRFMNLSESVGESRQNKRHASAFRKDLCLKTTFKPSSGAHYLEPQKKKNRGISDAIWDEYKKLGSTISKPLRDAIFKTCGLEPPFSDSILENHIGDNGFREGKRYSISSPHVPPQNLRSIGYENVTTTTRCVSSSGKRRAIVFSGRPLSKTCHQPFVSKKSWKNPHEDSQRNKRSRFVDGNQYMLSKEFQSVVRDTKKRGTHHYDCFEFPVSMSR